MAGIFKAYDIRGKDDELTDEIAYAIGRSFYVWLSQNQKTPRIVGGYDMRPTSQRLFQAFCDGYMDQGGEVISVGLCTTPQVYFACGYHKADGAVMITASHNPAGYNGFKLCGKHAQSLTYESGIQYIEQQVASFMSNPHFGSSKAKFKEESIYAPYIEFLCKHSLLTRPFTIVIDAGNGVGSIIGQLLADNLLDVQILPLYFELDGTFPNHEANPAKSETLTELRKAVVDNNADIGVAFDGDADRLVLVDHKGEIVPSDLLLAILAEYMLEDSQHKIVLHDLRASRVVAEHINDHGGKAQRCRVGHSYIQQLMRKHKALLGGELSGHFYFAQTNYCDDAAFALIQALNLLSTDQRPLADYINPLRKYVNSGEINISVKDVALALETVKKAYEKAYLDNLDGYSFDTGQVWFTLRASNTEPVIRLTAESTTSQLLEDHIRSIQELLRSLEK